MAEADRLLGMYLHLARASRRRKQPMVHVKLLVLAGVQAETMGLGEISALCRHKILRHNARHLVRKWPTMGQALSSESFQTYLKQLRRRYSGEKVEHMMASLGIEMAQERAAYFSDAEYAAALLDTRIDSIADVLAEAPANNGNGHHGDSRAEPKRSADNAQQSKLHNLLVVWAPFLAGVLALAALALFTFNFRP